MLPINQKQLNNIREKKGSWQDSLRKTHLLKKILEKYRRSTQKGTRQSASLQFGEKFYVLRIDHIREYCLSYHYETTHTCERGREQKKVN